MIGIIGCCYIFCIILDKVWVSDVENNFVLINIVGDILYFVRGLYNDFFSGRLYIVNNDNELIYISMEYKIMKFLKDMKIIFIYLELIDILWIL